MSRTTILGEGYLSEHLTRSEVRTKSTGILTTIDERLPEIFEIVRHYAGNKPAKINSAIRNFIPDGGVQRSEHMLGNAFDIGLTPKQLSTLYDNRAEFLEAAHDAGMAGFGVYSWGVHVDTDGQQKAVNFWAVDDSSRQHLMRYWDSGKRWYINVGQSESFDAGGNLVVDVEKNSDDKEFGFPWWIVLFFLTGMYFATKK